ncbi:MAG: hypothetical protein L3J00_04780 [Thiomicrorhabdus sp.]|nr:hypothetical protein [Thiomicrorhabdus sp.]
MESSQKLFNRSLLSEDQYLQVKQAFIEQTQDLKIEGLRAQSIRAQLKQIKSQQATLQSHTKQTLMQRIIDAQHQKEAAEQDHIKAQQRLKQYTLQSPIDGTVQQLAIHTIGGVMDSTIMSISRDAVENPDLGLVYAMRVQIEKNNIYVKNKLVQLSPGMQVTVEVKTGKRRIIEYLLTPLLRYQNESIRER